MSTEEALRTLTASPGIGPWSAGLVLLRGLGRTDVFPPGDVGAARGLRALMRRGPHAPLTPIIERFGEYRGYLYFCALGSSLLSKGLIHPGPAHRSLRKSAGYAPKPIREGCAPTSRRPNQTDATSPRDRGIDWPLHRSSRF